MRAAGLARRLAVQSQKRVAVRAFATAAQPVAAAGGFTAAQLGDMAVNGVRLSEVKAEKKYNSLPKVEDVLVRITLIDFKSDQYKIIGRVGDTLAQAAMRYGNAVPLEDDSTGGGGIHQVKRSERWMEDLYGEGSYSWASHVVISKEWFHKIPEALYGEKESLSLVPPEDLTPNSRLATEIVLTKELDGMVVYVPDPPPSDDVVQNYTL